MNWLTQNWPWLLLGIGVLLLIRRAGCGMSGFGQRHGSHHGSHDDRAPSERPPGRGRATNPQIVADPVTHEEVSTEHAITSVHQGRIYYFKTPESRQRFEAAPEQYARAEPPTRPTEFEQHRRRHRHGC